MFVSNGALVKTPITVGNSSWFSHMAPMSQRVWSPHYSAIFRAQPWVYVVVMKRARAVARLPLPVYRRDADDGRTRVKDHPMAKLLAKPNPAMSGYDLIEWTTAIRDIFGRAYWFKTRDRGEVSGLWPLHPSGMFVGPNGLWNFDNGRLRLKDIASIDLVSFTSFDPDVIGGGMSPLEPLRSTLENEHAARAATSSFWKRGARPSFAIEHPGVLKGPAYDRLRESLAANHEGAVNAGSTMIFEEGAKGVKFELTAEEAQYIETRKVNREEVCAVYDTPPPVVGILDHATFSNITEQMRSMYRDTVPPITSKHQGAIETDLRAVEWPQDDVYAEFLMDDVMRGDFETRQDALTKASHMTLAEKRAIENLPFIEGTNRIFLNTATMPLDAIDAQAAAIVASTQERQRQLAEGQSTPPEPKAVALRTVLGRLNWQRSLAEVDADALIKGLDPETSKVVLAALTFTDNIDELKAALRGAAKEDL